MLPERQHFEEQAEAAADDVNESEVEADSTPSVLVGDAEREEEAGSKKGGVAVVPRERADVEGAHSRSTEEVEDMLPIPMGEVDNIPDVLEVAEELTAMSVVDDAIVLGRAFDRPPPFAFPLVVH